jgi:hypothetical protein
MTDRYSLSAWRPVSLDDLVRVGRRQDGGYVISRRCIAATQTIIGLGISDDWSFEEMFSQMQPAAAIVAVDGSVSPQTLRSRSVDSASRALVTAAALRFRSAAFHLREAARCSERSRAMAEFFNAPRRSYHEKFLADTDEGSLITWQTLCATEPLIASRGSAPHLFVKMDIEAAEYRVLADVARDASRISGMAIEFHDCDLHWERLCESMRLMQSDFVVAHIHGNNYSRLIRESSTPRAIEVTFVNRHLLTEAPQPSTASYPLDGLDWPCDPSKPDYVIRF